MKLNLSKEWCLAAAEREGDAEVGVGFQLEDDPGIPPFLIKPKEPKSEIAMKPDTDVEAAEVDTPVAPPKPNGSKLAAGKAKAKPARGVKAKAVKATGKPAKAKASPAKAKAKAAKPAKARAKGKTRTLDPAKRDEYGLRLGSIKSKAAAMYGSKKGATLGEVKDKVGSIQFNVLTQLQDKGHKVKRVEEKGDAGRPVTRFYLT